MTFVFFINKVKGWWGFLAFGRLASAGSEVMFFRMWESGKWFCIAPLLGMGDNEPRINNSIGFATCGRGAV